MSTAILCHGRWLRWVVLCSKAWVLFHFPLKAWVNPHYIRE
jgi:hypothetical protein